MDISEKLKSLLESKKMSQYALAKSSGFSPAYVSQIVSGAKTPTITTIQKFCDAMGITISDFFADEWKTEPETSKSSNRSSKLDSLHQLVEDIPEDRREEVKRYLEFTIEQHKRKKD